MTRGASRETAAAARKNRQMGRVKKIAGFPSLIISEPTKFCSAMPPKMIPMMMALMENFSLFKKYPINPLATMTYTSVIEFP